MQTLGVTRVRAYARAALPISCVRISARPTRIGAERTLWLVMVRVRRSQLIFQDQDQQQRPARSHLQEWSVGGRLKAMATISLVTIIYLLDLLHLLLARLV